MFMHVKGVYVEQLPHESHLNSIHHYFSNILQDLGFSKEPL